MSDLVKRLRELADDTRSRIAKVEYWRGCREAAAEIERLTREREEAREDVGLDERINLRAQTFAQSREIARLTRERDDNLAAWERVVGERSEGEAKDYIAHLISRGDMWAAEQGRLRAALERLLIAYEGEIARTRLNSDPPDREEEAAREALRGESTGL